MQRRPPSLVLGAAMILLLTSCAPSPEPIPTRTPVVEGSQSPTPSPEPAVEPEPAFDVDCDDVDAALAGVIGESTTPVRPVMSLISTMNWIPGPAQHMFQRAGGIACSAGDDSASWEVLLVPGADAVIAGASERLGYWGERASCEEGGYCHFEFPDGQVLLSATLHDPKLEGADAAKIEEALRTLLAEAAASVHEFALGDSDIVGTRCERFITTAELSQLLGTEVEEFTDFGGWGVPAEVYSVVNGSVHCLYTSPGSGYEVDIFLQVTTLPAGAWAFEEQEGEVVVVEGTNAAIASKGEHGESILDVLIGPDWIRFMTFDNGSGAVDPVPLATVIVRNLTIGHTAPQ
ncbi:hypothetical protein ACI3KT_01875 [Microbacterium sp. ZW T6_19]|uniref:hypothetical protein n=1 Tax=Microbacterium sp. ZW T6_19 TaxID=3378082 RepID=UPI0038546A56